MFIHLPKELSILLIKTKAIKAMAGLVSLLSSIIKKRGEGHISQEIEEDAAELVQ